MSPGFGGRVGVDLMGESYMKVKEWRRGPLCVLKTGLREQLRLSSQAQLYSWVPFCEGSYQMSPETSLLTGLLLAEGRDNGAEDSGDTEDELRR